MAASADQGHLEGSAGDDCNLPPCGEGQRHRDAAQPVRRQANVAHYHVKKDTVVTNTLDEFMGVIQSLHAKFDNAEEIGEAMNVRLAKHLASVELDFCFVMGPNQLRGIDLFNLARQNGKWVIVHKSYWL
jgi:hypothetical protein